MLPNTYGFTDPAELQALAMERVRISFPAFSRRLADLERKYLAVGLNYHFIPLAMRTKADDSKVQLCTTSLTVRPSIDPADGLPEPCKVLQDLRDRRDAAKAAMKLGNGVEAETLIGMSRLDDFATCMETLDGAVNELMDAWAMSDGVMSGPHNQYEVENIKRVSNGCGFVAVWRGWH